ncbi:ribonuclease H-like domain-containing protein [Desulfonatronum thioautotrophicum]|uniref:ribonuclease H-like domain-containing protein n=1 Tax=Desulfonatronum thioautotrophicum TaxID=617001 RepID=UPI0005EBE031|nr:ribonuclease H-like domain-containing protein [Desulfonatronum thioautotrophicum]
MLTNTFCHLPRIGSVTERKIWEAGMTTWEDALNNGGRYPKLFSRTALDTLADSMCRLENGEANWFAQRLPRSEIWRLCSHFADRAAFVDIETTSGPGPVQITTIALYDGQELRTYVQGRNLEAFCDDILDSSLLVTFNGRCFDAPIIQRELRAALPEAHVDLRFVLRSIGLKGGLKSCERQMGLDREDLEGLDGYFAVLLWDEYQSTGDERALETLLAYNAADVLSMPILLGHAYKAKLQEAPFCGLPLPPSELPENPHQACTEIIQRIRKRFGLRFLPKMA